MTQADEQGIALAQRGLELATSTDVATDDPGEVADVVWLLQRRRAEQNKEALAIGRAVSIARKRIWHADHARRCDTGGKDFDWSKLAYVTADVNVVLEAMAVREVIGDKLADLLSSGMTQRDAAECLGIPLRSIERKVASARNGPAPFLLRGRRPTKTVRLMQQTMPQSTPKLATRTIDLRTITLHDTYRDDTGTYWARGTEQYRGRSGFTHETLGLNQTPAYAAWLARELTAYW